MADTTRREMLATAVAVLPATEGLFHVTVDEVVEGLIEPEPTGPQFTLLTNPPGPIERRYSGLGSIQGGQPVLELTKGGKTVYDFCGTIRRARVQGVTWQGAGCRSLYGCDGTDHDGGGVAGGAFIGEGVTLNQAWGQLYQPNNMPRGAVLVRECSLRNFTIEAPRIHGNFDGIQGGSDSNDSKNVTILRAAMTLMRDDGIENDARWDALTVDQCLFEGFMFFSSRNKSSLDGSKRDNVIKKSVANLLPVNFEDGQYCGQLFKVDKKSVRVNLLDNVFAAGGASWKNFEGAFGDVIKHGKLGESERNLFCWLGKGPNPHKVARGVTGLEGAEARQEYDKAVAYFWSQYPGHRFAFDPKWTAA